MKNKIIALTLALIAILSTLFVLTACGPTAPEKCDTCTDANNDGKCDVCDSLVEKTPDDEKEKYTFTVTVVDHKNAPIENVKVKFLYENKETEAVTTGADGKASIEIATEREVIVEFVDLTDYQGPSKKKRTFEALVYDLTLQMTPAVRVNFVDEDGNKVEGVSATICNDKTCLNGSKTSDADGECVFFLAPSGKYKVRVLGVPTGYAMPEILEGADTDDLFDDYHAYFADGAFEVTVTIPKA